MAADAGLSILDTQRIDRISAEAKRIHFGRTLLTLIGGLLWLIGWSVEHFFAGIWLILTWTYAAVKVGWQDSRNARALRSPPSS